MKSPAELAQQWARQWQRAEVREQRLLDTSQWPLTLPIGKPSASQFTHQPQLVSQHVQQWRAVKIGTVIWQNVRYRSASEPVAMPTQWQCNTPSEWIAATHDKKIQQFFQRLEQLLTELADIDPHFHRLLIRRFSLWQDKTDIEVIQATQLALQLAPHCAQGLPLRALALGNGIDSKFFERHRTLLIALLDLRYAGQVSRQGLESFLNASEHNEHWLLVVPLASGLLPFQQLRLRSSELQTTALLAACILLIENERCLHQLPALENTIAILGAGLDLEWLQADWLSGKRLGYWGDMDTWGLTMLAKARSQQAHLEALLMNQTLFDQYQANYAVVEPTPADTNPPAHLTVEESAFYRYLLSLERGRLEQERLPTELTLAYLQTWFKSA